MQNWHLFEMTIFEMYYYFWFWSIFGWVMEVVDRTLETGGFENRGFMNGPYCPIYGFGVIGITILLSPLKSVLMLYILSSVLCTVFELAVGLMLQALFHAKWWDYSDMKFNFKGYICLRNSLLWGVGCVLVVRVVQPLIEKGVHQIPYTLGNIVAIVLTIIFVYDLVESICEVRKLNNKLREIDALARIIHDKSVVIGEKISDEVLIQKAKYDKLNEKLADGVQNQKEKYERLNEKISDELSMTMFKYEMLIEQAKKQSRIIRAFPTMKSLEHNNALRVIREKLNIRK